MALFDTMRKDWAKVKGKPFKEKASYFFDYYKWPVIIILVIAIGVGVTVWQKCTEPDVRLCGVLFNASELLTQDEIQKIVDDFSLEQGYESGKETIVLHTDLTYFEDEDYLQSNYESLQILTTWIMAAEVDFIIADAAMMEQLAAKGYLLELPASNENWPVRSTYLLDVSGSEVLQSVYGDLSQTLTLGIAAGARNMEQIMAMIDYLEI